MSRLGKVLLAGAMLAGLSGVASAHDNVRFSISFGTPVYVEPAPVYYYPRTVYYEPRPVYYERRVVYDRPIVVYREHRDRGRHRGWDHKRYKHWHRHR